MALIAHMADVHLGYRQYGLGERENDIYEAFAEAVEHALREHVEAVIIAGDLFDTPRPPVKALTWAKKILSQLAEKGVKVLHVLGDHDYPRRLDELPPTALFDNLIHIGQKRVELSLSSGAVVFAGLDKLPPSMFEEAINSIARPADETGKKRVLVAHIPLERGGRAGIAKLPKGYSYYALGHEHRRQQLNIHNTIAAYPGSLEILSRAEIADWESMGKGFYLADLSKEEPILHEITLSCVRPQRMVETREEELSAALDEVRRWSHTLAKKPIVHLAVSGRGVDAGKVARILLEKLGGDVLYHRFEVHEEVGEFSLEKIQRSLDIRSIVREYMLGRGFGERDIELALRIYDAFKRGGEEELEETILSEAGEVSSK
ncbi:MAG: exonuclease SbcCD subunit D [Aigarchaeota archaeon]|nr:exonuclease SbcCD subunit D [Candidatus Pelearchaeum maunauluense]